MLPRVVRCHFVTSVHLDGSMNCSLKHPGQHTLFYHIMHVDVIDNANNVTTYTGTQLSSLGFANSFYW